MVYYTNKQLLKQAFLLVFGYSITIELTISTTSLACYVYDTVKMHVNDVKELKQKVVEDLQINFNDNNKSS